MPRSRLMTASPREMMRLYSGLGAGIGVMFRWVGGWCSQNRITFDSDVKLALRRRCGRREYCLASPRTSRAGVAQWMDHRLPRVAAFATLVTLQQVDCGLARAFPTQSRIWWVAYAAWCQVYRWWSPPSRGIEITCAFTPGRCSTSRWFGVSFPSES